MLPLSVKQPSCHGAGLGVGWPSRANTAGSQQGCIAESYSMAVAVQGA